MIKSITKIKFFVRFLNSYNLTKVFLRIEDKGLRSREQGTLSRRIGPVSEWKPIEELDEVERACFSLRSKREMESEKIR